MREERRDSDVSIMYKITKSNKPDYVGKQFRVWRDSELGIVIFDGDVKRKCNAVWYFNHTQELHQFFIDMGIEFEPDREYGAKAIESLEKQCNLLRVLYSCPEMIIPPIESNREDEPDLKIYMEPQGE